MHKHDWVTGLLSEIEQYCIANRLDAVTRAVTQAISVATEELDRLELPENIIYISDYMDKKILDDKERIIRAFSGNLEDLLLRE
jgi:hypothetical protein